MLSICKSNVVGSSQARFQIVSSHWCSEFVKAPEIIRVVLWLHQEVCDGRMMRSVFTVDLSTVSELCLQGFSKNWIEWFELTCANKNTTHCESNHLLESFQMVFCFSCLFQISRCIRPDIYYSLNWRSWFEYLDGKRDMRNGQAFEKVHSELFDDVHQHSPLSFHHLLISTDQPSVGLLL